MFLQGSWNLLTGEMTTKRTSAVSRVATAIRRVLHLFQSHLPANQSFPDGETPMRLSSSQIQQLKSRTPTTKNGFSDVKGLAYLLMLFVGLSFAVAACHSDRRESFYPSLADAKKDGAIDRGWIPDFLPESSRAIHEVHEISPSTGWCAFDFLASDSQALRNSLKSVNELPVSVRHVPSLGESWWPTVLEGNLDIERIHNAGFNLYVFVKPETSVTTDTLLFAINWQKGQGFFYLTPDNSATSR